MRVIFMLQVQLFTSSLMLYTSGILSLMGAATIAVFQPYKQHIYNKIDTVLMVLMGVYFLSYFENVALTTTGQWQVAAALQALSIIIFPTYMFSLFAWELLHLKIELLIKKAKTFYRYKFPELQQ